MTGGRFKTFLGSVYIHSIITFIHEISVPRKDTQIILMPCFLCVLQVESLEFLCNGVLATEGNRTYLDSVVNGVKERSAMVVDHQAIHIFTKVCGCLLQNIRTILTNYFR